MSDKKVLTEDDLLSLRPRFRSMARWYSRGDAILAEELYGEAWVGALSIPKKKRYYGLCILAAKCKILDFLRSKKLNYSYKNTKKHVSFEATQAAGYQFDTNGGVHALPDNTITIEGVLRNTYPWMEDDFGTVSD